MVTSNSMLANPTSSPSVSFLLAIRLVTVIPYTCEMHCPANVIMMVAVVLAPNRHQCIANHHRDPCSISGFTSSHQHNIHIPLRPLNKQYLREVGSSATCCWQWGRLLTRIMPYHIRGNSNILQPRLPPNNAGRPMRQLTTMLLNTGVFWQSIYWMAIMLPTNQNQKSVREFFLMGNIWNKI